MNCKTLGIQNRINKRIKAHLYDFRNIIAIEKLVILLLFYLLFLEALFQLKKSYNNLKIEKFFSLHIKFLNFTALSPPPPSSSLSSPWNTLKLRCSILKRIFKYFIIKIKEFAITCDMLMVWLGKISNSLAYEPIIYMRQDSRKKNLKFDPAIMHQKEQLCNFDNNSNALSF